MSDRVIPDPTFRIFKGQQRALGELMIPSQSGGDSTSRKHCIGYAQFRSRLREEPSFAAWFRPVCDDIETLVNGSTNGYERLTRLQHALVDLIEFLDDPPTRFRREYCTKL